MMEGLLSPEGTPGIRKQLWHDYLYRGENEPLVDRRHGDKKYRDEIGKYQRRERLGEVCWSDVERSGGYKGPFAVYRAGVGAGPWAVLNIVAGPLAFRLDADEVSSAEYRLDFGKGSLQDCQIYIGLDGPDWPQGVGERCLSHWGMVGKMPSTGRIVERSEGRPCVDFQHHTGWDSSTERIVERSEGRSCVDCRHHIDCGSFAERTVKKHEPSIERIVERREGRPCVDCRHHIGCSSFAERIVERHERLPYSDHQHHTDCSSWTEMDVERHEESSADH
jgi:hypothetical protein